VLEVDAATGSFAHLWSVFRIRRSPAPNCTTSARAWT